MIQIDSSLKCAKVGHNYQPIKAVCITKECISPYCCLQCVLEDHKNHDIKEFPAIREQINQNLSNLDRINELSDYICEFCGYWSKQIKTIINGIKYNIQFPTILTFAQLTNCAVTFRESIEQGDLIEKQKKELNYIKMNLELLKDYSNSLLENLQLQHNQYNQEIKVIIESDNEQTNGQNKNTLNLNNTKFALSKQFQGHQRKVEYVALSNDDRYLASSQSSSSQFPGYVVLWDLKSNKEIIQYQTKCCQIQALDFSNDNKMLGVGSFDLYQGVIEIFDLTNVKNIKAQIKLGIKEGSISRITFTDDSKSLISVSDDYKLRVWDLQKKKEINSQNCDDGLLGVAYSYQFIACCDQKGQAYLFESKNLYQLKLSIKWQAHSTVSSYIGFIKNSSVVMTSNKNETRFWNVDDLLNGRLNYFKEIKGGGETIKAFPRDDPYTIINCSSDVKFVNLSYYNSKELIHQIEVPLGLSHSSFAVTSDLKQIFTGGENKKLNIFEQL